MYNTQCNITGKGCLYGSGFVQGVKAMCTGNTERTEKNTFCSSSNRIYDSHTLYGCTSCTKALNNQMWESFNSTCKIRRTLKTCSQGVYPETSEVSQKYRKCVKCLKMIEPESKYYLITHFLTMLPSVSNFFHILSADLRRLSVVIHTGVLPDMSVLTLSIYLFYY